MQGALLLFGFLCFATSIPFALLAEHDPIAQKVSLLGSKECTFGPSFWCRNLTNAAQCRATQHCIQTVWMHQKLPPDHSSVCETCLEMVKEARDQLLSNETQEEIKEVFEGSCKLIPIAIVAKECCKLVDDFATELIDTLASQMNPQVVCSVAGLCNNERVHDLLQQESKNVEVSTPHKFLSDCEGCFTVMNLVEKKFHKASRDDILQNFLQVCGRTGSFSDACSNVVVSYFNEIYKHLDENLKAQEFCFLSGECSEVFHNHVNVEVTNLSKIGLVPIKDDNLPCDLCKQLVKHLQDVLIANTTEEEFHKVLVGVCKQTKSFKDECLSLVEQYYTVAYNFLVNELNGEVLCSLGGICPRPGLVDKNTPLVPLLPLKTVENSYKTLQPLTNANPELIQLPIERVMPQTLTMLGNTELCTFCQYFLHFVQKAITDPATEDKIKKIVDTACDMLPSTVQSTCEEFVATYGPALIALLAQEIDPSTVCPKLSLCASSDLHKIENVEVFMKGNNGNKPNCPLCLFAITSLEELINDKKTEESIKRGLQSLCSHFKGNIAVECNDFVNTYTDEIVKLLLKEFSPQQVCITLKLCDDKNGNVPKLPFGGEIETNQILDETIDGKVVTNVENVNADVCLMCEFLMSELQNKLKDNATEEEIKQTLHKVCNGFSSNYIKTLCVDFVDKYEDMVIQLLINSLSPSDVCKAMKLCKVTEQQSLEVHDLMIDHVESPVTEVNVGSPQCMVCKLVMRQIEKLLDGKINEDDIISAVDRVCNYLPSIKGECHNFVAQYGKEIIDFLKLAAEPSEFCSIIALCNVNQFRLEIRKCSVCEVAVDIMAKILQNPKVDKALEHVLQKTCRAFPPKDQEICRTMIEIFGEKIFNMLSTSVEPTEICRDIRLCSASTLRPNIHPLLGRQKCTRGPGYWCISEETANECGAIDHCKKKVWKQQASP
ncbi:hypothetical protein FQR65_LT04060 [Abscondita terminalis]|nr:hypothetical protein FQR65_LT04060 [Abscondita terminalis]